MKKALLLSLCAAASTFAADKFDAAKVHELREMANLVIGVLPDKMPGGENDTPAKVKLGEKLFFEKRLSQNNSISCNTCHQIDKNGGGVDHEPTSLGAFGKRGGRNSPTVLNAGFQMAQFWDGRAENLAAQAKGPILNPVEMAMASDADVLKRLKSFVEYRDLFSKAFPGKAESAINYDNVGEAIAAFERTLVTHDRFDDWQKGDDKALNAQELRGLNLFLTTGCTTCHNGPAIGGGQYQKVGLVNAYETGDLGRFDVTKEESDKEKFKVPMLRNVALTAPYFHDGKQKTLKETAQKMAWLQLGKKLSDEEASDLAAFLNSLSDKSRVPKES
jgi:cytochrome c peroxidase